MRKPNILFITTDQQRKDTLGCYGNNHIRTPNIDQLASDGVVFDRAYCENPICIPSRCTMITGKKSYNHGAILHNSSMRDSERTIGELLCENGYATHFIGKPHFKSQQHRGTEESIADWRDGLLDDWNGSYKGFETVEMVLGHSNPLLAHYGQWLKENHSEDIVKFSSTNLKSIDVTCGQGVYENDVPERAHSSTYVGERTCAFIDKMAEGDKPFYCFASFPDPHWPLIIPNEFMHMYDDVDIPNYDNDFRQEDLSNYPEPFRRILDKKHSGYNGGGHPVQNREDIAKITRVYWGSVSLIDKNVGKIIDTLKKHGMYDNTIIVFTTDHGEYMGDHGMMAKGGFLWEGFINVPYIMRYGDLIKNPIRTDAMFSFVDIVPTLLELADIENNMFTVDGISQVDVLKGESSKLRDNIVVTQAGSGVSSITPDQQCIVTEDGWKLIYFAGQNQGHMYNLNDDLNEKNNLFNKEEYRHIKNELLLKLLDEMILHNNKDTMLEANAADKYGTHVMSYDVWKPEFDKLSQENLK